MSSHLLHPTFHHDWLVEEVFCASCQQCCREGTCEECSTGSLFFFKHPIPAPDDDEPRVTFKVWMNDPETKFLVRVAHTLPRSEAADRFAELLEKFISHSGIKRNQAKMYRAQVHQVASQLLPELLVIHFDFAENFHCAAQDEIQAAYYARKQISLFTVVVTSSSGTRSLVLLSDNIDHGKEMVMKYLLFIFQVHLFIFSYC
jgi:hypothetical protein